jgi:hypothetical protein
MDVVSAAETIRRMTHRAVELPADRRGVGQRRSPAPALAALVVDVGLPAAMVDGAFDWVTLLGHPGIGPDARRGARP